MRSIEVKLTRIEEEDLVIFSKKNPVYSVRTEFEDGTTFCVERKMVEFEKLWGIMEEIYFAQIIPPLPENSLFQG